MRGVESVGFEPRQTVERTCRNPFQRLLLLLFSSLFLLLRLFWLFLFLSLSLAGNRDISAAIFGLDGKNATARPTATVGTDTCLRKPHALRLPAVIKHVKTTVKQQGDD